MDVIKPNLFIIGASKCGTTSLYYLLDRHDDCCMSSVKEPRYFNSNNKTKEWYLNLFRFCEQARVVGEASPIYSETTCFPDVPRKIYEFNPSAKIVYMVRHPYDRIKSVWKQMLSTGHHYEKKYYDMKMPLSFEKAVFNYPPFLEATKYWTHIQNYRKYFPDQQIMVVFFEDYVTSTKDTLQELSTFLEVKSFESSELNKELTNPSAGKLVQSPFHYIATKIPFYSSTARYIPDTGKRFVKRLTIPVPSNPNISNNMKVRIRASLGDELGSLFAYTNKPSDFWML